MVGRSLGQSIACDGAQMTAERYFDAYLVVPAALRSRIELELAPYD
jgi:hypothetical protein